MEQAEKKYEEIKAAIEAKGDKWYFVFLFVKCRYKPNFNLKHNQSRTVNLLINSINTII